MYVEFPADLVVCHKQISKHLPSVCETGFLPPYHPISHPKIATLSTWYISFVKKKLTFAVDVM